MSDIIVGSVGVQLVPSARGFPAKVKALTDGLTADVRLNADTKAAQAKLDEASHDRDATIEANADTAAADAKLDRAARTRKATILPEVSGFGALATGALTLGPALVPITAATVGLTAALGAPLVAGGGGLTMFGFLAGYGIKKTNEVSKEIDKLKAKAATLTDPKARAAAIAQADALTKSLTAPQQQFLKLKAGLSAALTPLSTSKTVFEPINKGLGLLTSLLPHLMPLLDATSKALSGVIDDLGKAAKGGGLDKVIGNLSQIAGPAIRGGAQVLGNIAKGFAGIGTAFEPLGKSIGSGLQSWSRGFANIGSSRGLSKFVGYVERVGPKVAHTLADVTRALGHIGDALAPIGGLALSGIDHLARGISKIPTKVLTVAAGALAGVALSLKAISLTNSAVGALGKLSGGRLGSSVLGKISGAAGTRVYVTNWAEVAAGSKGGGLPGSKDSKLGGVLSKIGGFLGIASLTELGVTAGTAAVPAALSAYVVSHPAPLTPHTSSVLNTAGARPGYQMPGGTGWSVRSATEAAEARKKAIEQTEEQAKQQLSLNKLLVPGVLTVYGKALRSLPKAVQTKIATPGAIKSVADITRLGKQYHLTPKQIRTIVDLENAKGALAGAKALGRQYGLTPKQVRTLITQAGMDASRSNIAALARQYHLTPRQVRTVVTANTSGATAAVSRLQRALNALHGKTVTIHTVNEVSFASKQKGIPGIGADGTTVPHGGPYVDRHPYLLAPGEEVISNRHGQADRFRAMRAAGMIPGLADGGHVPSMVRLGSPPVRGAQPHLDALTAAIVELRHEVKVNSHAVTKSGEAVKGETKTQKAAREKRHKQQEHAQKQLEKSLDNLKSIRGAVGAFSLSSVLPKADPKNPIWAGVKGELDTFEKALKSAGGKWTGSMQDQAHQMLAAAKSMDVLTRKRDGLSAQLEDMKAFSTSVSSQFLSNPFGQTGQMVTDPAVAAQLATAQGRLSGIQGDSSLAPLDRSAQASKAQLDVQRLTQLAANSQVQMSTLDTLRDILKSDTAHADAMDEALKTLKAEGLNKGAGKDLFTSLSASGDWSTAQGLASLAPDELSQYTDLWTKRAQAAAGVGATAVDGVYGKSQVAVKQSVDAASVKIHNAHVDALADSQLLRQTVRAAATAITTAVGALPKQTTAAARGGKGRS